MTQSLTPDYAKAKTVGLADIPVIDLAGTKSPARRAAVAAALVKAASEIGFFYVSGHGVSAQLCAEAMAASRRFFDLPEAAKAGITVDRHQRGWMPQGLANLEGSATHDAKEVFFWGCDVDADDEQVKAGLPLVHPNQWPDKAAPFLRNGILPYYRAVMVLGLRTLECLAIGLGTDPAIFTHAYVRPQGRGQLVYYCLLYTSPSPRDLVISRMPSSA